MSSAILTREISEDLAEVPTRQTRKRLSPKRMALAGAALAILAGAAWYGHDWWTTGRFIQTTDDAYVGGNITSIAPHVGGFIAEVPVTDNQLTWAIPRSGRRSADMSAIGRPKWERSWRLGRICISYFV